LIGRQADFDVAQRFSPSQLRKRHHSKQIGAGKCSHARVATVSIDDSTEGLPRHEFHQLRKQRLAYIHYQPRVS
jgi:hypothetical protein